MVNAHTHYPPAGGATTTVVCYFQNLLNWQAGYRHLTGMAVTRTSGTAVAISAGTYMKGLPTSVTSYAGGSVITIPATTTSYHRYDLIYLDTADGVVKRQPGTEHVPALADIDFLENTSPQPPDMPSEASILLAVICVLDSGIRATDNGTGTPPYSVAGVADMRMTTNYGQEDISYLYSSSQAQGDIITRGASAWGRLGTGTSGQYLRSAGTGANVLWDGVLIGSLTHASAATGDLVVKKAASWDRLPAGSAGYALISAGAGADVAWGKLALSNLTAPSETQGDLAYRGSTTWGRLAQGTAGQFLKAGGSGSDVAWTNRSYSMQFPFGDGTTLLAANAKILLEVPLAGTITTARCFSSDNTTGSVALGVWKDTYANGIPTVTDLIDTFSIVSGTKSQETGLSIAVAAGDLIVVNVNSVTDLLACTLSLTIALNV
jgi:hypothetical protein